MKRPIEKISPTCVASLAKIIVNFQSRLVFVISIFNLPLGQISTKLEENKEIGMFYLIQSQMYMMTSEIRQSDDFIKILMLLRSTFDVAWHF